MTTARHEFDRRVEPGRALAEEAESIARACHAMALRFQAGGKLVVFGNGPAATDADHIAVEFVHPVIVGKRALPALSLVEAPAALTGLARDRGWEEIFAHQVRQLAAPTDIAVGVSPDGNCPNVLRGLEAAHALGCLTVVLAGGDGGAMARTGFVDHPLVARSDDPQVVKEIHVTTYHILWELVHVFFERGAVPSDTGPGTGAEGGVHGSSPGGSSQCDRGPQPRSPADASIGHNGTCITCSDEAVPVRILELRPGDLALVDTGAGTEEVSVALVDARVGATVLVHAKEAIAVVEGEA